MLYYIREWYLETVRLTPNSIFLYTYNSKPELYQRLILMICLSMRKPIRQSTVYALCGIDYMDNRIYLRPHNTTDSRITLETQQYRDTLRYSHLYASQHGRTALLNRNQIKDAQTTKEMCV